MGVSKCANAYNAYLECTNYAVTQLNLDNVAMYLDAGKKAEAMLKTWNSHLQDTPDG